MNAFTPLFLLSLEFLNVPYIFGSNDPLVGLDCSSFVQIPLKRVGVIGDDKDRSAQMIYDYLKDKDYRSGLGPDSLLFFGKSRAKITHIGIAVNDSYMIEAAGGDRRCTSVEIAKERGAKVKFSPITKRKDLIACISLNY